MEKKAIRKWEELDLDCLVCIFERVRAEDLILAVPFVCKSWHEACLHPQCWRILDFRRCLKNGIRLKSDVARNPDFKDRFTSTYRICEFSRMGFLKLLTSRCNHSAEVVLPPELVSYEELSFLSEECRTLKEIYFAENQEFTYADNVPGLIEKWKHLKHLDLQMVAQNVPKIIEAIGCNCSDFLSLSINGVKFNDETVTAIINWLPRIKFLNLSWSQLSQEYLLKIMRSCTQLKFLNVVECRGFYVDDNILKILMHECLITKFCFGITTGHEGEDIEEDPSYIADYVINGLCNYHDKDCAIDPVEPESRMMHKWDEY